MADTNLYDCVKAVNHYLTLPANDKRLAIKKLIGGLIANRGWNVSEVIPRVTSNKYTTDAIFDRMNPNLMANVIYYLHLNVNAQNKLDDTCINVLNMLGNSINDDSDNVVVRGGKRGFAWSKEFTEPSVSFAKCQSHIPDETILVGNINLTFTGKEKRMGFDVNKTTELVVGVARKLAEDDIALGLSTKSQLTINKLKEAQQLVGNAQALSVENRKSIESACELLCTDVDGLLNDEVIEKQYAEHIEAINKIAPTSAPSNDDSASDETTEVKPVEVDDNMVQGINALLTSATKSKITDIRSVVKELAELKTESAKLMSEVSVLQTRATSVPIDPTGNVDTADMGELTYKVIEKKASDIFKNPRNGRKISQLDFNIPTLEWSNDKGEVVQHPHCPPIDHEYQFRASHLISFLSAFVLRQNVWCHGHTGSGKTTLPAQVCARIGFPVFPLNLDSNLERADLTGQTTLVQDQGASVTKFEEGVLPKAMVQPCFLVLDEIDASKPDLLFVIQRATEGNGLLLTEDGGRLVKPHPLFRFVATANSRGQGDEHGVYAGVRPLNGALLNRFGMFIEVKYMEADEEQTLLAKKYPSLAKDFIANVTQFARLCRNAFSSGETSVPVSPRDTLFMCQLYAHFFSVLGSKQQATEFAIQLSVLNRCPIDNKQRLVELADRCFADCKFTIK
jgi:cobaltochelatase CobS